MKVSHSQLNTYNTCPALYYWGYVVRIKPSKPNYDLMYGGGIHEAEAVYFTVLMNKGTTEQALNAAKAKWTEIWITHNLASYAQEGTWTHKTAKTLEAGMKFIDKVAALGLEKRGKIVSVEKMQEKILVPGITYRVKLDLLIEAPGEIQIVNDYKTKGRLSSNYFYFSVLDRQMKGYAWGANGTHQVDNNVIILHCIKNPQIYENPQSFEQDEIDLWKEETISMCNTIRFKLNQLGEKSANYCFPRAATSCQIYGCWAADLCMQGRLDEAQIDPGRYVSKDCEHGVDLQESCKDCGRGKE